ncbi:MAG: hypothetical protein K2H65_03540, partial [Bacteroidales bacterium]|nr:hypothetical protein [Bacteroidales bacterium]
MNCANDQMLNGRNETETHDATHPFVVCAGEAVWPTPMVYALDNAGRKLDTIRLFYAYNSTATNAFTVVKMWTRADGDFGDVSTLKQAFDPKTETVSGYDFTQPGSHYYQFRVTREGNNSNKTTPVVEYVVGAMPEPTVVSGGTMLVSTATTLAAAKTAGATNTLTVCAGPEVKLYLDNMPNLSSPTSHLSYQWYKGTATTGTTVPNAPTGLTTVTGTGDNTTTGSTAGITSKQTDYYYAYRKVRTTTNARAGSTPASITCDTLYPLSTAGVRIVNPMPNKPTVTMESKKTVCPGETFDLNPTVTGTPNTGVTWGYRWYKKRGSGAEAPANPATASADDLTSASWTGIVATPDAGATTAVDDVYRLVVHATTTEGCKDSITNLTRTITINPLPTMATPTVTVNPDGGKVCANNTVTLTANEVAAGKIGSVATRQWYKMTGATPDKTKDTPLSAAPYAGGTSGTLTITANSAAVTGSYYMAANLTNSTCSNTVYSEVKQVTYVARPEVRIKDTSFMTYTLCT